MTEVSWCRHCGLPGTMTEEHVPARSAGNAERIRQQPFPGDESAAVMRTWEQGLTFPTLCSACNANGSRWGYVREYRAWRESGIDSLKAYCKRVKRHGKGLLVPGEIIPLQLTYDRMPGRFARYVIGMLFAVQRNERLAVEHPHLLDAVKPSTDDKVPRPCEISPVRMYLNFANHNTFVMTDSALEVNVNLGGRTDSGLHVPPGRSTVTDFQVIIVTPFAFVFVLDGPTPANAGVDVSSWTTFGHHQRVDRKMRKMDMPAYAMGFPPKVA